MDAGTLATEVTPEIAKARGPIACRVRSAAGHELAADFFRPEGDASGAVLIVPAMGVTQTFYAPLAQWLATRGYCVATFDYQGMGRSLLGKLSDVHANLIDWAADCAAMIDVLADEAPGRKLFWIGHSLGGQLLPLVANGRRLAKAVTISAGNGYWRYNSPGLKWRVLFLWYVVAPMALPFFGYFPGKRLGIVGDLPRGAMEQWRRWCLDPDYLVGAEGPAVRALFAAVETPLYSISFTDDELLSAQSILSLHDFYARAPKQMTRIRPQDAGEHRIGHHGFFRPRFESSLWRPYLLPALV